VVRKSLKGKRANGGEADRCLPHTVQEKISQTYGNGPQLTRSILGKVGVETNKKAIGNKSDQIQENGSKKLDAEDIKNTNSIKFKTNTNAPLKSVLFFNPFSSIWEDLQAIRKGVGHQKPTQRYA
jgi:hypothetical protein